MTKPDVAIIIDTETGSTDIKKAGICQLAAVVLSTKGNATTLLSTFCKPRLPMEEGAIATHGITEDQYRYAPPEQWALTALHLYLSKMSEHYNVYLSGHNVDRYDLPLMQWADSQNDWSLWPTIDTLRWARRLLHDTDHKLGPLYDNLIGKPMEAAAHDAAVDCHMGAAVLHHLLTSEGISMADISASLAKPRFYEFMPFGKYQGMALGTDVPKSYLLWMRENFKDPDPDLAETIRYYLSKEYDNTLATGY